MDYKLDNLENISELEPVLEQINALARSLIEKYPFELTSDVPISFDKMIENKDLAIEKAGYRDCRLPAYILGEILEKAFKNTEISVAYTYSIENFLHPRVLILDLVTRSCIRIEFFSQSDTKGTYLFEFRVNLSKKDFLAKVAFANRYKLGEDASSSIVIHDLFIDLNGKLQAFHGPLMKSIQEFESIEKDASKFTEELARCKGIFQLQAALLVQDMISSDKSKLLTSKQLKLLEEKSKELVSTFLDFYSIDEDLIQ